MEPISEYLLSPGKRRSVWFCLECQVKEVKRVLSDFNSFSSLTILTSLDFTSSQSAPLTKKHLNMCAAFRRNLLTEPVHTVDLYQVMCALLGISPSPNNGTWDRINNILAVSDNQTMTIHVSKASAGLTSSFLIMSFMYFLHSRCIER